MKPQPKKPLRPTMNQDIVHEEPTQNYSNQSSNNGSNSTKPGPFSKPTGLSNPFAKSTSSATASDDTDKSYTYEQPDKQTPNNDTAPHKSEMNTQKSNIVKGYTKSLTSQAHSNSLF